MSSKWDSKMSDSFSYSSYTSENSSVMANQNYNSFPQYQKQNSPQKIQQNPRSPQRVDIPDMHPKYVSYLEYAEMERQMKQYQTDFHEAEETIDALEQSLKAVLLNVSNVTQTNVRTIDDALRIISNFAHIKQQNNEGERVKSLTEQLSAARHRIIELENNSETQLLRNKIAEYQGKVGLLNDQIASLNAMKMNAENNATHLQKKLSKVVEENQKLKQRLNEAKQGKTTTKATTKSTKSKRGKGTGRKGKGKISSQTTKAASPQKKVESKQSPKKGQGQAIVEQNNAKIASLETRIRELQFELEACRDSLRSPESSLTSESTVSSIIMNEQVLVQFEELVSAQSDEIHQLYEQRDQLLELATMLETNVEECEDQLYNAEDEKQRLEDELEAAHNDIGILQKNIEITIDQIRNRVVEILPQSVSKKIQLVQNLPAEKQIIEYFGFLVAEMESISKRSQEQTNDSSMGLILSQLENALRFLQNLSLSYEMKPLLEDNNFKYAMMSQIKEIQDFVNQLPKNTIRETSIFDAREAAEKQLKVFLNLVDGDAEKSPARELFDIFSGVVIVNKYLMQRIKTLEPLRQSNDKKEKENNDLISLLQEEASKQDDLTKAISPLVDDKSASFYEMIEELINKYIEMVKLRNASLKDLQNIKNDVSNIEKKTAAVSAEQAKKFKNKISELKRENARLQKDNSSLKADNQKLVAKVVESAQDSTTSSEYAASQKSQLEAAQEQIELLKAHKTQHKLFETKCSNLESELAELHSRVSELTTKNAISQKVINQVKEENKNLLESREKLQKTNRDLKDEIAALKKINNQILADIKNRNQNLSEKIDGRLKEMEKNVEQANQRYDEADAIRKEFHDKKKDYQKQIAQLKASERTLTMKVEELEKAKVNIKETMKAELDSQLLAARVKNEQDHYSTREFVVCCCNRLVQLIESNFLIKIGGEIDLWDIVNILEEQLHKVSTEELSKVVNDNAHARSILGANKQEQLWEAVEKVVDDLNKSNEDNKNLKQQIEQFKRQLKGINQENEVLLDCKAENEKWEQWSKNLYQTITNGKTSENYRNSLEELILAGIGNKTIELKLSLLRTEKELLKSHKEDLEKPTERKVYSIRPQTIAFMFIRRLQICSGTVPYFIV